MHLGRPEADARARRRQHDLRHRAVQVRRKPRRLRQVIPAACGEPQGAEALCGGGCGGSDAVNAHNNKKLSNRPARLRATACVQAGPTAAFLGSWWGLWVDLALLRLRCRQVSCMAPRPTAYPRASALRLASCSGSSAAATSVKRCRSRSMKVKTSCFRTSAARALSWLEQRSLGYSYTVSQLGVVLLEVVARI